MSETPKERIEEAREQIHKISELLVGITIKVVSQETPRDFDDLLNGLMELEDELRQRYQRYSQHISGKQTPTP